MIWNDFLSPQKGSFEWACCWWTRRLQCIVPSTQDYVANFGHIETKGTEDTTWNPLRIAKYKELEFSKDTRVIVLLAKECNLKIDCSMIQHCICRLKNTSTEQHWLSKMFPNKKIPMSTSFTWSPGDMTTLFFYHELSHFLWRMGENTKELEFLNGFDVQVTRNKRTT